jgi:purine-cytosine permease-like protein
MSSARVRHTGLASVRGSAGSVGAALVRFSQEGGDWLLFWPEPGLVLVHPWRPGSAAPDMGDQMAGYAGCRAVAVVNCLGCRVGLFGGEAAALLLGIPFWAGAALVLAIEGLVSVYGYEFVHRLQSWGSAILIILFVVLTVRIFGHHIVLPVNTVHGGALAGAFVLMMTIALSQGISWATYASDYSRYLPAASSRPTIFWLTPTGLTGSYVWVETIGLGAASVLGNQTVAGVRILLGGGTLGVLVLIAVAFGAITSNSMNDYTGSLAFQALGVRFRRPVTAALVAVLAFVAILWMHSAERQADLRTSCCSSATGSRRSARSS